PDHPPDRDHHLRGEQASAARAWTRRRTAQLQGLRQDRDRARQGPHEPASAQVTAPPHRIFFDTVFALPFSPRVRFGGLRTTSDGVSFFGPLFHLPEA